MYNTSLDYLAPQINHVAAPGNEPLNPPPVGPYPYTFTGGAYTKAGTPDAPTTNTTNTANANSASSGYGSASFNAATDAIKASQKNSSGLYDQLLGMNSSSPTAPTLPSTPNLPQYSLPAYQSPTLIDPQSGPVISKDLLNQQVNRSFGSNAQQAATASRTATEGLAGRGLGSNSPLARALNQQIQGSMLGANSQSALAAQENAASQNAQYAQAMNQAYLQNAANVYGSQTGATSNAYGSLLGGLTNLYGTQVGGLTSIYSTQAALENARRAALASAYGSDTSLQGQLLSGQLSQEGQLGAADISKAAQITASQNAMSGQLGAAAQAAAASRYSTDAAVANAQLDAKNRIDVANLNNKTLTQNQILQSLAAFAS